MAARAVLAAAVATVLAGAMAGPLAAQAAAPVGDGADAANAVAAGIPVRAGIGSVQAEALAGDLGPARTAGTYFDQRSGRIVVTVTDAGSEQAVSAAGGVAKRVRYSTRQLTAVTDALDARIDTSGTAWGTEVDKNRISVTADSTVSDADFAAMRAVLSPYGDAAVLTHVEGKVTLDSTMNGGKYIGADDGTTCSAGFNVQKKSDNASKFLLTAGHCTVSATGVADWSNGAGEYFGYDAGGRYPGTDYGLIKHNNANVAKPGNVYDHNNGGVHDITHSRDPGVGEAVCLSGYRSGVRCGTVSQLNVTVNYGDGEVRGLFRSNICRQGGDSGGSIWHGDAALGIHSGGVTGQCIGYHQRVNPALAWYGVEVY